MKVLNKCSKSKRLSGHSKGKIGLVLNISDKNNNILKVGDTIEYQNYKGILLYNPESKSYGVAIDSSLWYGTDIYDINSYGKFIDIPMDNGGKMFLTLNN